MVTQKTEDQSKKQSLSVAGRLKRGKSEEESLSNKKVIKGKCLREGSSSLAHECS